MLSPCRWCQIHTCLTFVVRNLCRTNHKIKKKVSSIGLVFVSPRDQQIFWLAGKNLWKDTMTTAVSSCEDICWSLRHALCALKRWQYVIHGLYVACVVKTLHWFQVSIFINWFYFLWRLMEHQAIFLEPSGCHVTILCASGSFRTKRLCLWISPARNIGL